MTETKSERIARERLRIHCMMLEDEKDDWRRLEYRVPDAWHTLAHDLDVREPKVKVTLYLDRSVARAFRAMGHGYQARINRLLATYVTMQAARVINFRTYMKARGAARRNLWEGETEEEKAALSGRRGVVG